MAQHIVALDLGATAAHVAVIAATFRRARLLQVISIPVAPGEPLASTMQKVRDTLGVSVDNFVCGLDARQASVHGMLLPFTDVRKAPAAVDFELESRVPFDMQAVVVCWRMTQLGQRNMQILAAVTPKGPLTAQLEQMAAAGLEPRAVMHPAAALQELLQGQPEATAKAEHSAAVLCMGANQAHLCLVREKLHFMRSLRFGGDAIDHALSRSLEITLEEARALKQDTPCLLPQEALAHASHEARRLHTAMVGALDPLVSGLFTTLKTLEPHDRPHRILLTGGASLIAGLEEYLLYRLGIVVARLDLGASLGALDAKRRTFDPAHAVVLAMAMSLFRHGQDVPFNFRHGAMAYKGDLQLYRGQLTRVAMAVLFVFLFSGLHAATRWGMLRAEERDVNRAFGTVTEHITGHAIYDPVAALATLRQSDGSTTAIPSYSASGMLEMLSKRLPASLDIQFDELDFRVDGVPDQPDRITGKGDAVSFENIEQLVALLKADPCVQDAEVSKQRKSQNAGRVEFSLAIKVKCPAGVKPGAGPLSLHVPGGAT
jgi:Tfp pilus assembly PilM family ATPase